MTKVYYSILLFSIISIVVLNSIKVNIINEEPKIPELSSENYPNTFNSILIYETIEKYSDIYNIPKHIAYNIAYKETTYKGPFHWNYNPYRTSVSGAEGPMQVMPSTARIVNNRKIKSVDLRTDIELNISTSMKLLSQLYKRYGDWELVCGAYNTGRPIINEYASYCANNKNYIRKWSTL